MKKLITSIFILLFLVVGLSGNSASSSEEISSRVNSRLSVKYEKGDYKGVVDITTRFIKELEKDKALVAYDSDNYMLLAEFHLLACDKIKKREFGLKGYSLVLAEVEKYSPKTSQTSLKKMMHILGASSDLYMQLSKQITGKPGLSGVYFALLMQKFTSAIEKEDYDEMRSKLAELELIVKKNPVMLRGKVANEVEKLKKMAAKLSRRSHFSESGRLLILASEFRTDLVEKLLIQEEANFQLQNACDFKRAIDIASSCMKLPITGDPELEEQCIRTLSATYRFGFEYKKAKNILEKFMSQIKTGKFPWVLRNIILEYVRVLRRSGEKQEVLNLIESHLSRYESGSFMEATLLLEKAKTLDKKSKSDEIGSIFELTEKGWKSIERVRPSIIFWRDLELWELYWTLGDQGKASQYLFEAKKKVDLNQPNIGVFKFWFYQAQVLHFLKFPAPKELAQTLNQLKDLHSMCKAHPKFQNIIHFWINAADSSRSIPVLKSSLEAISSEIGNKTEPYERALLFMDIINKENNSILNKSTSDSL